MTAPKKPADRKAPTVKTALDGLALYGNDGPALVITRDEMADILKPYVFQLGSEVYALKSPNSFSVDDFGDINDLASDDVTKVLGLVAFDERTEEKLSTTGLGVLTLVINGWRDAIEVKPGESVPSES